MAKYLSLEDRVKHKELIPLFYRSRGTSYSQRYRDQEIIQRRLEAGKRWLQHEGIGLKTIRPRIEPIDEENTLFDRLSSNIEKLSHDFGKLDLRLKRFTDLKKTLSDLNKDARKYSNVYLLRSIVIFFDSIKHAFSEDLTKEQLSTIKEVSILICNKKVDREVFKEIYKKLLKSKFQILPEPKT